MNTTGSGLLRTEDGTSMKGAAPSVAKVPLVAVIGSFRRDYAGVVAVIDAFRRFGWTVTSPSGSGVIDPSVDFVRFDSDDVDLTDAEIQSVTLARIFTADATYVVVPDGYVGRTTCYEIGRLIQSRRPVYFSEIPNDLPIRVPEEFVVSPARLVEAVGAGMRFESMHERGDDLLSTVERGLIQ